jgi:copper(I)-binding protein
METSEWRRGAGLMVAAAALWPAPAAPAAQPDALPRVESAWARPTVPGQVVGGGFLRIRGGAVPDRLMAASTDAAQATELHAMQWDGTVMRMRQVDGVDVPAGQTVELKPGGTHVMLIGLVRPLTVGAQFPLTLRFAKAGEVKVDMTVMLSPLPRAGNPAAP